MKTKKIVVGILGYLGVVSGLQAATGSQDDKSLSVAAPLISRADIDRAVAQLAADILTGENALSMLHTLVLNPHFVQPVTKQRVVINPKVQTGTDKQTQVIVQDSDTIIVTMENGKIVTLDHNGKKIPPSRLKKDGNHVKVTDDSGAVVIEFDLNEDGGGRVVGGTLSQTLPYSGSIFQSGLAPVEPPKVMIGVQLGEPDGLLLGHFGLEPGEATLVTGVYSGLAADKAGLKPYDIIVGVNGAKTAGQIELREVLRGMEEGQTVNLTVIHRGEKKDVKINLEKYDQEALAKSKLDGLPFEASFMMTSGGSGDVIIAPGIGSLRSMAGEDAEKWREFTQRWRWLAEGGAPGSVNVPPPAVSPAAPPAAPSLAPSVSGFSQSEPQWKRLEERLERLEKMIERLAESQRARPAAGG